MTGWLLDTNVVSELKRPRPSSKVVAFIAEKANHHPDVTLSYGRLVVRLSTHDANGVVRPFAISLLHPAPKRVLMIGLSSGSWARVIASNPAVESMTIVEINPGYVELAGRHAETKSILTDPKINIVADDGRRWLAGRADARYDMIVSNTTFNFRANISNLLSREFIELAASRLAPGGLLFYNTTGSDRVQRTACLSFPHGLRFTNHMAISGEAINVDFDRWRKTLLAYSIDGKPVIDPANPKDVAALERLMAFATDFPNGRGLDGNIEPCSGILQRTAGRSPITDDNMGTEWRMPLGLD